MYERTRLVICRIAFFALCLAPTLGVLAWATAANWPGGTRAAEVRLVESLELDAEMSGVSYPQPGVTLYRDLELIEPASRRVVAGLGWLEVKSAAGEHLLSAEGVEVNGERLDLFWNAIARRLRIGGAAGDGPTRFSAKRLTISGERGATTFADVTAELSHNTDGSTATLRFTLPEGGGAPIELRITRLHGNNARTTLTMRTGSAPLPLSTLHTIFPALAHLGPRTEFAGTITAHESSGRWSGEVAGRLVRVDLDDLVTRQFPYKLSGEAEIVIQKLAFSGDRLAELEGRIEAGPGAIERALVETAGETLGMRIGVGARGRADEVFPYDRLAATFQMNPDSVRIEGAIEEASAAGCALTSPNGAILWQAESQPRGVLDVIRLLAPRSTGVVPANEESQWLLSHLPLVSATSDAPRPRIRGVHGQED